MVPAISKERGRKTLIGVFTLKTEALRSSEPSRTTESRDTSACPRRPESSITQTSQSNLITSRYVLSSHVIIRFFHFAGFFTLCLFRLDGVICDRNKVSDKLTTATCTICVASLTTAPLAVVTLPVLAGWSRTLPTLHEHLRCETSIECSSEAELHYAITDNLLSVGVLEWPVCKQQDELLTSLDSTGLPVWLMNIALFWEMTPF